MFRVLIFGGTTEGRELAEFCCRKGIDCGVSVATEIGASLLPDDSEVFCGRLDSSGIARLIRTWGCSLVVDATHPYAAEATENIRRACTDADMPYYRLLRGNSSVWGETAGSVSEAAEILNRSDDIILSTLGSKSLTELTRIREYRERLWLRLLPSEDIAERCISLGFDERKLILGRGPFSVSDNKEHIRLSGAEVLLTKESGAAGGYPEKSAAAAECGIRLLTVLRPEDQGMGADGIKQLLLRLSEEKNK